ncbi:hypothetical protein NLJ89_g7561 [Agrocybe chaxingu]|uniref:Uncharacterized protein n=1 Tax=Agrocybe chaxingu TaxID=84603 RepID=A0A9W8JX35_9AGAR|nr:hypothetical protein NLJ89_g7561 [Agrocybe chaxingu]
MHKNEPYLPISDKPFWERDQEEDDPLNDIADSCVLLQSLKQSRERWLFRTFPKFSSKSRGNKNADAVPPPHTIQTRGRCDLEVGPHIFPDTLFYEVHYLPTQASQSATANSYWHTASYSHVIPATTSQMPQAPTTVQPEAEKTSTSTPFMSSLPSVAAVTPSLISQVNTAASSNPILANLLQLAAAGKATPDQLKTLGLLIQSLANLEKTPSAIAPPSQQLDLLQPTPAQMDYYRSMPTLLPVKEFDIVIEFRETPNDRWLFPRGPVYAERKPRTNPASLNQDISLLTCLPFDNTMKTRASEPNGTETSSTPCARSPVTLTIKEAPATIWDTITRWTGGDERMNANKAYIEGLVVPPRLYLGLQLPPGPTLTQLQQACASPYTMKTLKQGPTASHTRAPRKRTNAQRKGASNSNASEGTAGTIGESIVVKRPRTSKSTTTTPIQCHSCKQTDVPLIMGGRFCRPCAERQTDSAIAPPSSTTVPAVHALPPSS